MKKSEFFHKTASTVLATPKLLPTSPTKNPPFLLLASKNSPHQILTRIQSAIQQSGAEIQIPAEMVVRMRVAIPAKDAIVMSGQARFYDPAAFHRAMVRGMGGSPILQDDEDQKRKAGSKILNFVASTAPLPLLLPLF